MDLWVLKEFGVTASWTKLVSIPYMSEKLESVKLVELLPHGEILFVIKRRLAIYNPRDNVWTYLEIRDHPSFKDAHVYVQSLVSSQLN